LTAAGDLGYQSLVEGILAIVMIFGMPVFIVGINKYYKYKALKLEKASAAGPEEQKRIAAMEKERALLEERVQNLETIVCSVDLELNARLNRLAAHQSVLALPPPANATPPTTPAGQGVGEAATLALQASSGEVGLGTTLMGRFQVEQVLGRGGMGAVYLAVDKQLGEQVALKVIGHSLADDPGAVERFRREASAARKITHPNVIRIHDLGEDSGLLFLSMEYFPGMTLAQMLGRRHQLPVAEARQILLQICDALAAAHAVGVIHRDLKPQNVLVNEQRQVRVIDFGLAKATFMPGMTATGLIMGTPEYMAPEQIKGGALDQRTDIYALGAVAYHALCGRPPFLAASPIAVGFLHCSEPPRPPRELRPDLPEPLEAAILRALAKEPAERFASVAELRAALG
jgi:predicted Ser/Thr protein kinase